MQIDGVNVQVQPELAERARSENLTAALLAALLGAFLIWGVGFSPIAALHNAAHDTRHSMAFPCH